MVCRTNRVDCNGEFSVQNYYYLLMAIEHFQNIKDEQFKKI